MPDADEPPEPWEDDPPPVRYRDVRRTRAYTRAPAAHHAYFRVVDQEQVRRLWSDLRAHPVSRDLYVGNPEWIPLDYADTPTTITCGNCRRMMGRCVAYRSPELHGVVEDTARWKPSTHPDDPEQPLYGRPKHRPPWFAVHGEGMAAAVQFICPHCRHQPAAISAHELGSRLFERHETTLVLG